MQPPFAPVHEHNEVRHREVVGDPYYWLREKSSPETLRSLEAENAYTSTMTKELEPFAGALYDGMLAHSAADGAALARRDAEVAILADLPGQLRGGAGSAGARGEVTQSTIAHYRIVSKLGEGGMGAVYRATEISGTAGDRTRSRGRGSCIRASGRGPRDRRSTGAESAGSPPRSR